MLLCSRCSQNKITGQKVIIICIHLNNYFFAIVETQTTIGYGSRAITEKCGVGVFIMSIQCIVGVLVNGAIAGVVFSKFTIPANRSETIIFSKNATITMRNGCLFLLCRVADLRTKSLLEGNVRMVYFKDQEITEEGREIPNVKKELKCGVRIDGTQHRLLLLWPTVISHRIDEKSPLFELGPNDLMASNFELIVTLVGIVEETGKDIQVRTSYLPNEICWGFNFDNDVVRYKSELNMYSLNTKITNKIQRNHYTPRISAKQLLLNKTNSTKYQAVTYHDDYLVAEDDELQEECEWTDPKPKCVSNIQVETAVIESSVSC